MCYINKYTCIYIWAFLVAQKVKYLPTMQETWVWSLGLEDPLEEDTATHFSILAWRIPIDKGAWRVSVHGVAESGMTERLSTAQHIYIYSYSYIVCYILRNIKKVLYLFLCDVYAIMNAKLEIRICDLT